MKRKNREISIFSMSALDLFASALGAFILIAIVMIPHFPNTTWRVRAIWTRRSAGCRRRKAPTRSCGPFGKSSNGRCRAERAAAQRELAAARSETARLQRELEEQVALEEEHVRLEEEHARLERELAEAEGELQNVRFPHLTS